MKKFRSKGAFERNAAYVHIHGIEHTPQRTVDIAGRAYQPGHVGETPGHPTHTKGCHNCGQPTHTHYHGSLRCCGMPICCSANSIKAAAGFDF